MYYQCLKFMPCILVLIVLVQMGLVEREWLETLATINVEQVTFTDYVDKGRELASQLRAQVGSSGDSLVVNSLCQETHSLSA